MALTRCDAIEVKLTLLSRTHRTIDPGQGVARIMALAVAVNLIELLCSAGIPAAYTQVLALSGLSAAAYYGYLMLYISVFLLDDAIVFVAAMLTLQATGLAATYSRYSHLIGGVVLVGVGPLLIFRPEWLAFVS